jgi:hypothetical protein
MAGYSMGETVDYVYSSVWFDPFLILADWTGALQKYFSSQIKQFSGVLARWWF